MSNAYVARAWDDRTGEELSAPLARYLCMQEVRQKIQQVFSPALEEAALHEMDAAWYALSDEDRTFLNRERKP